MVARRPRRIGQYTLVEPIGIGGMAEVWRSERIADDGTTQPVVVKRIRRAHVDNAEFAKMFMTEAKVSMQLHHENIVSVLDFGREEGELFLVLEYVHGRDLLATMRAGSLHANRMPVGQSVYIAHAVACALRYAHTRADDTGAPLRLIHRDVSPDNVLLGFDGSVKLADFGIAKALSESTATGTATGVLKGKTSYMAPEQLAGRRDQIDVRVDIYSLGVVLHEMLTGRRLFSNRTIDEPQPSADRSILPPSQLNPDVPPALDALCLRALARDPADRVPDAAAFVAALDELLVSTSWNAARTSDYLRGLFHGEELAFGAGASTASTSVQHRRRLPARARAAVLALVAAIASAGGWAAWRFNAVPKDTGAASTPSTLTAHVEPVAVTVPAVAAPQPAPAAADHVMVVARPTVAPTHGKQVKNARPASRPSTVAAPVRSRSLKHGDVLDPFEEHDPSRPTPNRRH